MRKITAKIKLQQVFDEVIDILVDYEGDKCKKLFGITLNKKNDKYHILNMNNPFILMNGRLLL